MAITKATYNLQCDVTETIALGIDGTDDPIVVSRTATSAAGSLSPSSPVPGTTSWPDSRELAAGTDTLDLQALTKGDLSTSVDLSGLKIQLFKVVASAANTGNILIAPGAANGYNIFGHAAGEVTLLPGMAIEFFGNDALDDVAAADSEIDFTSADQDAAYDVHIVAG